MEELADAVRILLLLWSGKSALSLALDPRRKSAIVCLNHAVAEQRREGLHSPFRGSLEEFKIGGPSLSLAPRCPRQRAISRGPWQKIHGGPLDFVRKELRGGVFYKVLEVRSTFRSCRGAAALSASLHGATALCEGLGAGPAWRRPCIDRLERVVTAIVAVEGLSLSETLSRRMIIRAKWEVLRLRC